MTEKELFAAYKKTAPGLDLDFFISHNRFYSQAIEDECFRLKSFTKADGSIRGISRPEFYRRLKNLQDMWRRSSNAAERAESTTIVA